MKERGYINVTLRVPADRAEIIKLFAARLRWRWAMRRHHDD